MNKQQFKYQFYYKNVPIFRTVVSMYCSPQKVFLDDDFKYCFWDIPWNLS